MEFKTQSGAKVKINPADFEDALELQAAIAEKISESKISFKSMSDEIDVAEFLKAGMSVAADKNVREILFKCLVRCTYNGQKITKQTFEDVEARKDFYEVAFSCLKENVGHFIAPLISKLSPALEGFKTMVQGQNDPK